tara:strand:- start:302 stop:457 length:156 start_codon:yes stop_codon:yes gene_type:complete
MNLSYFIHLRTLDNLEEDAAKRNEADEEFQVQDRDTLMMRITIVPYKCRHR